MLAETSQLDPPVDALYNTIPLLSLGGLNFTRTAHGELPNTRILDSAERNPVLINLGKRREFK